MTKFFIFVAVCTLVGGGVVQAHNPDMIKMVMECAQEFSITKEALKDLDVKKLDEIVPSENLKVYRLIIW